MKTLDIVAQMKQSIKWQLLIEFESDCGKTKFDETTAEKLIKCN